MSEQPENIQTYREALFEAMDKILSGNDKAFIFGQGVDDFKGIFGTTSGLPEKYGASRCFDTPLMEEGMTGIAVGAALGGLYPIMTHIRTDFVLLAMNQIVNHAAKYRYMFGGHFSVPMMVRTIIGRSWGQGAQHSQSLQSLFAHIPGLTVFMPFSPQAIREGYEYAARHIDGPVVMFEHRLLYDIRYRRDDLVVKKGANPLAARLLREGRDVTIVSTSIMTLEALRATDHLAQHSEISADIIDLGCVSHIDMDLILESLKKTGRLIVADTSWPGFGVCAEICRRVVEHDPTLLRQPVKSVGMAQAPCPTAKALEDIYYPNLTTLADDIACQVTGRKDHGILLPSETSMADVYKKFKGPF